MDLEIFLRNIDRIHKIDDHLYLGGIVAATLPYTSTPDEEKVEFKAILSVMDVGIPEEKQKDGVVYHHFIADDLEDQDLLTYFPETNEIIGNCQKSGQNIYVHCMAGISRSATLVTAYLMHKNRLTAAETLSLVRDKRPVIDPNDGFLDQLNLFEKFGYTLNANNRQLRRYLAQNLIRSNYRMNLVKTYFERRTVIEKSTPDLQLGQQYDCSSCGQKLFNQIHIIANSDDPNNVQTCATTYVEAQEWMSELLGYFDAMSEGLVKCSQCKEGIARFQRLFYPFVCDCNDHSKNSSIKIQMISNSFKPHEDINIH